MFPGTKVAAESFSLSLDDRLAKEIDTRRLTTDDIQTINDSKESMSTYLTFHATRRQWKERSNW